MAINKHLVSPTLGDDFSEDGCGFGPPDDRMASPIDSADAGGVQLIWGPAPDDAVRVRLDSFALDAQTPTDSSAVNIPGCKATIPVHLWAPITHRLPAWTRPGGWFVTHADSGGCGYVRAVFFDRRGRSVSEPRW